MSKIKIYADGASIEDIKLMNDNKLVSGFTTNPSLMLAAGVESYYNFASNVSEIIGDKSISFEVLEESPEIIYDQALKISKLSKNVYVKIPIVDSKGNSLLSIIDKTQKANININITAVFTEKQLIEIESIIKNNNNIIISIFAGRIADTGIDPVPTMQKAVKQFKKFNNVEILWASPREVLNYYQAKDVGCHIITMQPDLISKLKLHNKDLNEYSIETSKMFFEDAKKANYKL